MADARGCAPFVALRRHIRLAGKKNAMDTIRTARTGAVICIVGAAAAVVFSLALIAGFEPASESPFLIPSMSRASRAWSRWR